MQKFDNAFNRLCSIGFWEAWSSILLFFVAMPLKYGLGNDVLIRPVGLAHGILWMLYIALAALAHVEYRWPSRVSVWLFVASIVPAGPFFAEAWLLKKYRPVGE